jgi:hypothetical protein
MRTGLGVLPFSEADLVQDARLGIANVRKFSDHAGGFDDLVVAGLAHFSGIKRNGDDAAFGKMPHQGVNEGYDAIGVVDFRAHFSTVPRASEKLGRGVGSEGWPRKATCGGVGHPLCVDA